MCISRISLLSAAALATCMLFGSSFAYAQSYKVEPGKPKFDDLTSPEFGGTNVKKFQPKDWLEVEASFKVQMAPEPPSKTLESLIVKWYIAVKHPDKAGAYLLLTKDITHVNLPLNEDIFSSVYLSPASIKRLTGSDRAGKGAVSLVGYEIVINGNKLAHETNESKPGWWNSTSDKISRSDTVPLLNKLETPFANMWWDRYAEIQSDRR